MIKLIFFFSSLTLFADHTLYIKGMSCGMCVETITQSLKKANISPTKVDVGSVIFKEDGSINCKVAKAIEGSTEYKVFLDKSYTKPACPKI